jgi:hypothetical protein
MTLEEQMAQIDATLRTMTMPVHIQKAVQAGIDAQAEFERQKAKLVAERQALADAMKQQVSADLYERRKAEREAEDAATAKAQAGLAEETAQRIDAYDDGVTNLRRAAAGFVRVLAHNAAQSKLAAALTTGRAPDILSPMQLQTDLSQLWLAILKEALPPEFRNRFGTIEFGSSITARHPPGIDHVEAERKRMAPILALTKD